MATIKKSEINTKSDSVSKSSMFFAELPKKIQDKIIKNRKSEGTFKDHHIDDLKSEFKDIIEERGIFVENVYFEIGKSIKIYGNLNLKEFLNAKPDPKKIPIAPKQRKLFAKAISENGVDLEIDDSEIVIAIEDPSDSVKEMISIIKKDLRLLRSYLLKYADRQVKMVDSEDYQRDYVTSNQYTYDEAGKQVYI
jgi:hypothetical protein